MALQGSPRHPNPKPTTGATWPTVEEWNKTQQTAAAFTFRRLGIGPKKDATAGIWASQVLDVLGPGSFAQFAAVRSSGRVLWCNFELARQLGFNVPRTNQLTPDFHDQLLAALSFRAAGPTDDISGPETVTMYADRYGGDGVTPGLGAGRAGFLPYGNLYVKGVGFTPLFKHNDPNDFVHSHGGVHLEDCLTEAVFGEVNHNLFTQGSSRLLAVIDQGRHVTEPSGRQRHIALAVRAGAQLRPGHLLGKPGRPSRSLLDKFVAITRATAQLVTCVDKLTGDEVPDVAATMLRVIDDHARTGAEGFRWRLIHGAISSSNMEMSGAMLDLPTQSTQPRTAPVWTLDYAQSVFGAEHKERGFQLVPVYRKLLRSASPELRQRFNMKWLNIPTVMDGAYRAHLELKLLSAAGLKTEVAQRIRSERPELAGRFTDSIMNISRLKNPGTVSLSRSVVNSVSVLDVFGLLGRFPAAYFGNPDADHTRAILRYLKPVYRGNRLHIAKKKATVAVFANEFANLYRQVMDACMSYASEYYAGVQSMQASIVARAAFENEPLDALYYYNLYENMRKAIAAYKSTGNAEIIREGIDQRISTSLRSVDSLLRQGCSRLLAGGGIELEMRTINGINYSVRAWNDLKQTRRLHVSIPVVSQGNYYLSALARLAGITRRQIRSLRYRFTTNGWKSFDEVKAVLKADARDGLIVDFDDIVVAPVVGRLEGAFWMKGTGGLNRKAATPCFGGFTFAIPDELELMKVTRSE